MFFSGGQSQELVTVNMDDLGDLLSKPSVYYAKKSDPKAARNRPVEDSSDDEDAPGVNPAAVIPCSKCSKTFKRATNLQLHMERVHHDNTVPPKFEIIPETHK